MRRAVVLLSAAVLAACGEATIIGGQGGGAGAGGAAGGGAGGAAGGGPGTVTGMPCEVAVPLTVHCITCHGADFGPPVPYPLLTRDQLAAAAPGFAGQTVADRCVARMKAAASPMPPGPLPPVPAADIAAFEAWIAAGLPAGTCADLPDAGVVLTCASGARWTRGINSSFDMNPGYACQECHLGRNFNGQNPTLASKPGEAWFFMGTVFPGLHEEDRCNSSTPPGLKVEILDESRSVVVTMYPSTISGNFASHEDPLRSTRAIRWNQFTGQYTARVVNGRLVSEMTTLQTSGDCNTCHTERGRTGAPGRIVYLMPAVDAGPADAGATDAGATDAGATDAGAMDAGAQDAGATDAGATDAGATDAGTPDAGAADAGAVDAGAPDAGPIDSGVVDAGPMDGGADAGTIDPDGGADAGACDAGVDGGC